MLDAFLEGFYPGEVIFEKLGCTVLSQPEPGPTSSE